jgi:simple sugar transport system permease protein
MLFGVLRAGGNMMQMIAQVPLAVIYIIQAIVIILVISGQMIRFSEKKRMMSMVEGTAVVDTTAQRWNTETRRGGTDAQKGDANNV